MNLKNKYDISKAIFAILTVLFGVVFFINVAKLGNNGDITVFSSKKPVLDSFEFSSQNQKPDTNLKTVFFDKETELTTVETKAFYWQIELTTVVLPDTIQSVEKGAFDRCYNLENLVICATMPPSVEGDLFVAIESSNDYWNTKPHKNFAIFVPDGSIETYKNTVWGKYNIQPISNIQSLLDKIHYEQNQAIKSSLLSLPFFVSILALIIVFFKESEFVTKNSTNKIFIYPLFKNQSGNIA